MKRKKLKRIVVNTYKAFTQNELPVYAGNATLYIFMSFVPLLLLIVSIINLLPLFNLDDLAKMLETALPNLDQIQRLIMDILRNLNRVSGGLVLSVSSIMLLYSASRGVSAIQKGLMKVYLIKDPLRNIVVSLLYTLVFIILVPALLIFHLLGDSVRELLENLLPGFIVQIGSVMRISSIITVGISVVIVLFTYLILSGRTRSLRSQLPGTIFTLIGWDLFSRGFAFFIPRFWKSAAYYGPIGSVFLVIMWLRTMVTILLLGAALNRALEMEHLTIQEAEKEEALEEHTEDYAEEEEDFRQ